MAARRAREAPLWLKIAYTSMVCVIVPVYWRDHGPANFLWFSDIALLALVPALWLENRLLASMMAVGVTVPESAWLVDFIAGGRLLGLAAYMFDDDMPLHLRGLSLFHVVLLPTIFWMLARFGYDRRALWAQTILALVVLPLTYLATDRAGENINWVHGWGTEPQTALPPLVYLGLIMVGLPLIVYVPTHLLLKWVFPDGR
ncbi:MAG: hypothetical protein WD069_16230 [Planctomycetales bacterium]